MCNADCYSRNINFKSHRMLESRANFTSRFTQKIDDSIQNISKPSNTVLMFGNTHNKNHQLLISINNLPFKVRIIQMWRHCKFCVRRAVTPASTTYTFLEENEEQMSQGTASFKVLQQMKALPLTSSQFKSTPCL